MRVVSTCAECGRAFQGYDAAPRLWCSVYCETAGAREAAIVAAARAEGEAAGRAAERAAVVAWLHQQGGRGAWTVAQNIERGEHVAAKAVRW